jgi:anti-sigma-K factor RskA
MSHEPYLELAAAYALGALEGEDRSRFEAHLKAGCRECETALADYGRSLAGLASELPPVAPPPGVKDALLARIDAQARAARVLERPSPHWPLWRWAWAGTLASAAVAVVYLGFKVNALDRELVRRVEELTRLKTQMAQQEEVLRILRAPDTVVVTLGGLKPSPTAQGRMWWHREAGGFFVASGLPETPSGKTYQLWAIAAGKPMSAGVFDVDPKGAGSLQVKPLREVQRVEMFAVTLEPAGGLPHPSGDMYLAGKVL